MQFSHFNPTIIEFGKDKIKKIIRYVEKNNKVLFVYGGGSIKKNGIYNQVIKALEGYEFIEFSGVEPNPTLQTMDKAVKLCKEENIDFILAVGGGSVIDGSKYVAAASLYDGDGWDFLIGKERIKKTIPLGVVLTLPATGSESNGSSVISNTSTKEKRFFQSKKSFPVFSILDPSVMSSLSDWQLSNGFADAFVHTCEQYITYPTTSLVNDGYAQTLLKALNKLADNWSDRREEYWQENLMMIANQALNGTLSLGVPSDWATHFIGHELTAFYGICHGRSLAIIQPQVLRIKKEQKKEKLLQMGKEVFDMSNHTCDDVIEKIESIYEKIGISINLNDYGIDDKVIENVTSALEKHNMSNIGEHGDITLEVSAEILKMSMKK